MLKKANVNKTKKKKKKRRSLKSEVVASVNFPKRVPRTRTFFLIALRTRCS